MKSLLIGFGLMICAAVSAMGQSHEFQVEHRHTLRNHTGKLIITPEQIEYRTDHKNESRVWRYNELQQITIVSPTEIVLKSYEDRKRMLGLDSVYKFNLLNGQITPEISALLLAKSPRPPATSVMPTSDDAPAFIVTVKHLHRFGGCTGVLKIFSERMVYAAETESDDSRYWRYADVRGFSQSERFRLEIFSFEEGFGGSKAYNFQLREDLPSGAYDFIWQRVYPSRISSNAKTKGMSQPDQYRAR